MPNPSSIEPRRPTLADVAAIAGTSVPTVSKVLRGGTDVSLAMRRAVMAAVESVGYAPREPRRPDSDAPVLLDFVLSDVHGSWANQALTGVEEAATDAGHDVVLTIARGDGTWVQHVLRRRSAGAIITLVDPTSAQLAALRAGGVPLVLIDPMSRPPSDVASVGVTNWDGGRVAAEHLLALGHRRFAAIGGTRGHRYSRARLDGFQSAVQQAGGGPVLVEHADWRREPAALVAEALLDVPDRPTAVFACSDLMAIGVYEAARRLGLRIPDDLSVVGFDDVPEAAWGSPPLTTVRQPIAELGAAAVRMLLRVRTGRLAAVPREELATELVVRASTAPPAA
ncbi:substrate-binding domain-containing protein [Amnibacterium sp. CER49]|uniref:LacI family DNA-binding transcriptional regulator n=1 Tax=Amnibacterium sp. CER49 TaxID=3039161 RepID=UPI00244B53CE|nr:substrate-binding domain-containing protein [Amnibacterium sp. CER49]MDH2444049.1 substrate-binding domain-containing protein [Amnibacterium sp. CER49]